MSLMSLSRHRQREAERDAGRKTTSAFTRTAYNHANLGFYPTDETLAGRLGALFHFQSGNVPILEPCAGKGDALEAFLKAVKKEENTEVKGFCVELEHSRAQECRTKKDVVSVIQDDFINGVRISNGVFPIVWANPPYGDTSVKGVRMEEEFLASITRYMKVGGYLVWIVPDACMGNPSHAGKVLTNFNVEAMYRFDDKEYAKFHQYALILKKKAVRKLPAPEEKEWFLKNYSEAPYIPANDDPAAPTFEVVKGENPKLFTSKEFHAEAYIGDMNNIRGIYQPLVTEEYHTITIDEKPPTQLKDESLYMCLACGVSAGVIGDEKQGTKHLLKGVIEDVETKKVTEDSEKDSNENLKISVRTSKQVRLTAVFGPSVDKDGREHPAEIVTLN